MGQSASAVKAAQEQQQSESPVVGHHVPDIKTGYRWATDPIISDSTIVKKPLGNKIPKFENTDMNMLFSLPKLPGEVWGPYKKQFTKSILGGQVFTPPESVDGVPLLCRCRDIHQYMRENDGGRMLQGFGAVTMGTNPPACWDDSESLSDMLGGMYYYVMTRHPNFYAFAASKHGLLGVAKNIVTGPVGGPLPLAIGALALSRGGTRRKKISKRGTKKNRRSLKK